MLTAPIIRFAYANFLLWIVVFILCAYSATNAQETDSTGVNESSRIQDRRAVGRTKPNELSFTVAPENDHFHGPGYRTALSVNPALALVRGAYGIQFETRLDRRKALQIALGITTRDKSYEFWYRSNAFVFFGPTYGPYEMLPGGFYGTASLQLFKHASDSLKGTYFAPLIRYFNYRVQSLAFAYTTMNGNKAGLFNSSFQIEDLGVLLGRKGKIFKEIPLYFDAYCGAGARFVQGQDISDGSGGGGLLSSGGSPAIRRDPSVIPIIMSSLSLGIVF